MSPNETEHDGAPDPDRSSDSTIDSDTGIDWAGVVAGVLAVIVLSIGVVLFLLDA